MYAHFQEMKLILGAKESLFYVEHYSTGDLILRYTGASFVKITRKDNARVNNIYLLSLAYFHFGNMMKTLGKIITDIDLNGPVSETIIKQIKKEVHEHILLIFKNQGVVSGPRHVEISRWFGDLESTFYKHPRSPDPDVFRVSNDETEGCTNVGRTGWHIDGSFMTEPFTFSLYHMVSIPKSGNTGTVLPYSQ
jgi:alpha-ketoglutarate-dependent taurine dioxygenase